MDYAAHRASPTAATALVDSWSNTSCEAAAAASAARLHATQTATPAESVIYGNLQEADKIRLRREAKKNRGFYVEDEAQLVFVIRIRGINDMAPKVSNSTSVACA